jgi:chromosome segregation ATPase
MPKISFADLMAEWESLLAAAAPYAKEIPHLEGLLQELQSAMEGAKALEMERQRLRAERQAATQKLEEKKEDGREAAMQARATLKAALGLHNEILVAFNIRPQRRPPRLDEIPDPKPAKPDPGDDPAK